MRIRYHFIANLHITETRPILFLSKCDKDNIIGWAKAHSKTRLKMKQNTAKIEAELQMYFDSGWGELFSEKTSVQVSAVPKLIVSL